MNNKYLFTLAVLCATSMTNIPSVYGQNMVDGVRFGSTDISGTARYRSMAGAFGALGGDISCMTDNPAGLAIYRGTNILTITPHIGFSSTETMGSIKATGKDNNASVSNFGTIFSFKAENDYLINFNLGFSIERKLQTYRKMNTVIDNPHGAFGEFLFLQANSFLDDPRQANHNADYLGTDKAWDNYDCPLMSLMAYDCHAIGANPLDPKHVIAPKYKNVFQQSSFLERTRHDSYNISGALNFSDVFYAGLTINITDFNSMLEHCFTEDSEKDMSGDYITYDNRIETKGSGIGIDLGILWKPTEQWRLGATVHTPVWMNMKEFNDANMEAYNILVKDAFKNDPYAYNQSDYNDVLEYDYSTPWEYQFSTAYIFGSRAILSLEYDLRDYKTMRFSESQQGGSGHYYDDMNNTQKQYLQAQHTFKGGLEYRVTPQISLRAGYAYKTSPYSKDAMLSNVNYEDVSFLYRTATKPNYTTLDDQHYITGGIGWRGKSWTFDLSCVSHSMSEYYSAYTYDFTDSDILDFKTHTLNWDLTIGYRF